MSLTFPSAPVPDAAGNVVDPTCESGVQGDLQLRLCVREDPRDMALCVARMLALRCARAVAKRGVFTLALSGGRTPLELFRLLRSAAWEDRIDWPKTTIFWVDERCVPLDHPDSNAGAALQELFDHVPIGRVCRMRGEDDPAEAARAYEDTLRALQPEVPVPRLDCVLLGMGADGHTASLFPGGELLDERARLVADCLAPNGKSRRLTLTLPVLNAARCCLFMVSGTNKRPVLADCLNLTTKPHVPAQQIHPWAGELIWVVGQDALPCW